MMAEIIAISFLKDLEKRYITAGFGPVLHRGSDAFRREVLYRGIDEQWEEAEAKNQCSEELMKTIKEFKNVSKEIK